MLTSARFIGPVVSYGAEAWAMTKKDEQALLVFETVAYPGIFFRGGSTNSIEVRGQRGRGSGGGSPLVRGSGGNCNLVQEISFPIVKFS